MTSYRKGKCNAQEDQCYTEYHILYIRWVLGPHPDICKCTRLNNMNFNGHDPNVCILELGP